MCLLSSSTNRKCTNDLKVSAKDSQKSRNNGRCFFFLFSVYKMTHAFWSNQKHPVLCVIALYTNPCPGNPYMCANLGCIEWNERNTGISTSHSHKSRAAFELNHLHIHSFTLYRNEIKTFSASQIISSEKLVTHDAIKSVNVPCFCDSSSICYIIQCWGPPGGGRAPLMAARGREKQTKCKGQGSKGRMPTDAPCEGCLHWHTSHAHFITDHWQTASSLSTTKSKLQSFDCYGMCFVRADAEIGLNRALCAFKYR